MDVSSPLLKKCRHCSKEKPLDQFWARNNVCIECNKARWKERVTPEKRAQYNERAKKFDELNIARYLLRQAKKRAKRKGLECTIRPQDITIPEVCPILREPLVKNRGQWSNNSYSLDRRDSSLGYIPGNVFVISWKANALKEQMSVEQIERLLAYMKGQLAD